MCLSTGSGNVESRGCGADAVRTGERRLSVDIEVLQSDLDHQDRVAGSS
jgi:hypothetical protein